MSGLFDTIGGIPVHALVVHAAVVLVPLTALGAILMAVRPSFSRRFGTLVVLVAFVAAGACVVAKESGEQLARHVGSPQPHVDLGSRMPLVAGVLFLLVLVFWLFDRGIPANKPRPMWLVLLAIVLVVASVGALYWTFRVGDSGAKAVWEPIMSKAQPIGG
ncbi:MAG: hypothetical protein NTX29_13530 [Actinobacteria bacterium]|nr:hypothetical protein [Actinomycetota bacterium]